MISFSENNENRGLGLLSEENLEKLHKKARVFREKKARLSGFAENMTDMCNRINITSDPVVQFFEPRVKCTACDGEGHTKRKCIMVLSTGLDYSEAIFWSHIHPSDRPEAFKNIDFWIFYLLICHICRLPILKYDIRSHFYLLIFQSWKSSHTSCVRDRVRKKKKKS